jgi:hypothetical protein
MWMDIPPFSLSFRRYLHTPWSIYSWVDERSTSTDFRVSNFNASSRVRNV